MDDNLRYIKKLPFNHITPSISVAMGCPCSKSDPQLPRRRQEEKRQRQLAKLQKRNARKRRNQRRQRNLGNRSGVGQGVGVPPQLRLAGGSNGSTATECISELYARSLEQQRQEEHHQSIELRMCQQLERHLQTFLLNQLLLGVQFFGHYDHELAAIDDQLLAKQRACAQTLTEHSLLVTSAIDTAVARRLLFKPIDGPHRGTAQPLQKPLTYVIFENVDVARPNDANYDSIAALCKVLLETDFYKTTPCRSEYVQLLEQCRWMGYVRLKMREATPILQRNPSLDADLDTEAAVYTDASSGYSTAQHSDRGSLRDYGDHGDYDHVYIARQNTQRPMEELQLARIELQRNVLPEACICRLGTCLPAWLEQSDDEDLDDDDDQVEEQEEKDQLELQVESSSRSGYETVQVLRQCHMEQQRRRALLQQCYLSSQQFMHYFGELLRQHLAHELGISQSQLRQSSYRGCSVYTATEQLVPAIHVPHGWPDCAFEFNIRARPQLAEKETWPTTVMRKRIQSFGYHVVPVGYAPKRSRNPFRELEWRIVFPQAEEYLERQLSGVQLKLLQLMKALMRTFVNDRCQAMGHIVEQLRTHLFWHCERGTWHAAWKEEEFLGEQLVRFVRSFADCLARKQLGDYFIQRRNLFEHVPEDALMELHGIMSGIAEQPLVHVLQALRNLQHAPDFYPKLNYGQLLETLVSTDYLKLRGLAKFSRNSLPVALQAKADQELGCGVREEPQQEQSSDAQGLVGMRQHQERSRGKLRRKTQMLRAQQLKLLAEQRRQSEDSGTLDMHLAADTMPRASLASRGSSSEVAPSTPQLNDGVEILRRTNLLEQLLDHMLAMLNKAVEFRNRQHAQLYLEQGQRLCRLYQQLGCSQYAPHYAEAICGAANRLEQLNSSFTPNPSPISRDSPMRRKSLRFVEHVVQLHTSEQHNNSPPTATATAAKGSRQETAIAESQPPPPAPPPPSATNLKQQPLTALNTLFERIQLDPPLALQSIGSKTEQLLQQFEMRDKLKRNTEKLRSVLN